MKSFLRLLQIGCFLTLFVNPIMSQADNTEINFSKTVESNLYLGHFPKLKLNCEKKDGYYILESKLRHSGSLVDLPINVKPSEEFRVNLNMQLVAGDIKMKRAILFGGNGRAAHYYYFNAKKKLSIGTFINNEWQSSQSKTISEDYNPYDFNDYTIERKDGELQYSLNGNIIFKEEIKTFLGPKRIQLFVSNGTLRLANIKVEYPKAKTTKAKTTIWTNLDQSTHRNFTLTSKDTLHLKGGLNKGFNFEKLVINSDTCLLDSLKTFSKIIRLKKGMNHINIKDDANPSNLLRSIQINYVDGKIKKFKDKRIALIMGNSDYQNGSNLKNPIYDAEDMNVLLQQLGFKTISCLNCTQNEMKKAIDEFGASLNGYDVCLVYYAGHGIQLNGINYLLPIDVELKSQKDVEFEAVRADRILSKMESSSSFSNVIILDACRNNPFESSWNRSARGKGLAAMNAPSGSLIAYSTAPGNVASDGEGSNGLYTSSLLKYLSYADLSIEQLFKLVRTEVLEESNGNQIPWESTSLIGEFIFNPSEN